MGEYRVREGYGPPGGREKGILFILDNVIAVGNGSSAKKSSPLYSFLADASGKTAEVVKKGRG